MLFHHNIFSKAFAMYLPTSSELLHDGIHIFQEQSQWPEQEVAAHGLRQICQCVQLLWDLQHGHRRHRWKRFCTGERTFTPDLYISFSIHVVLLKTILMQTWVFLLLKTVAWQLWKSRCGWYVVFSVDIFVIVWLNDLSVFLNGFGWFE